MKVFIVGCMVLFSLCLRQYAAAEDAMPQLMKARSLKCEFGPGSHAKWDDGSLVAGGASSAKFTIHYDSIDPATRTARVIGTGGAADLRVLPDTIGVTLIEIVPMGGLAITTIYGSHDARGAFPAVMSKHVNLMGPFPQQYYGSCIVWQ